MFFLVFFQGSLHLCFVSPLRLLIPVAQVLDTPSEEKGKCFGNECICDISGNNVTSQGMPPIALAIVQLKFKVTAETSWQFDYTVLQQLVRVLSDVKIWGHNVIALGWDTFMCVFVVVVVLFVHLFVCCCCTHVCLDLFLAASLFLLINHSWKRGCYNISCHSLCLKWKINKTCF